MAFDAAYRRTTFTWFAFASLFTFGLLNSVLGPILPYLRTLENISYAQAVVPQIAFSIGGGLAGVLGGKFSRGHALPVRAGLAGMTLAALALAFINQYAVTVSAAFVMSLCGTSTLVALWAALADEHGRMRSVAMTEGEVAVSLGGIIAPLAIAGLAGVIFGWRSAFVVIAVVAAAVLALSMRADFPVRPPAPRRSGRRPARFSPTLAVAFGIVSAEWCLTFWLASYLNDSVGIGRALSVGMVAVLYAGMLLGRLVASRLARKVSAERLLAASIAVAACGTPIVLFAHAPFVAGLGIAVVSLGLGPTYPLTSSIHVGASGTGATGAVSQMVVTGAVGQIAGPLIAGLIAQAAGLRLGMAIMPALLIGAGIALWQYSRRPASMM